MQTSKKKVNKNIQKQIEEVFLKLVVDITSSGDARLVFWEPLYD